MPAFGPKRAWRSSGLSKLARLHKRRKQYRSTRFACCIQDGGIRYLQPATVLVAPCILNNRFPYTRLDLRRLETHKHNAADGSLVEPVPHRLRVGWTIDHRQFLPARVDKTCLLQFAYRD